MAANTEQSGAKQGLRKPVFVKVDALKPGTNGHNLAVKVLSSNTVVQKGRSASRIDECLVGDETGAIVFTARNDQGMRINIATGSSLWWFLICMGSLEMDPCSGVSSSLPVWCEGSGEKLIQYFFRNCLF